jgi:hypothetical protein
LPDGTSITLTGRGGSLGKSPKVVTQALESKVANATAFSPAKSW